MIDPPKPGTKYRPLYDHLVRLPPSLNRVILTFEHIEAIIGRRLPPSAHHHVAWWSNNFTPHVQARAWMAAGWRTEAVPEHQDRREMLFVRG